LLKLKKLQILGFKSFCDRTELKFHGEGIAAIVGPNGCGKSNLSDAISWVLGEQSAKSLRGARMEDVIFAGTPARKATGMAEVSLTLIDPDVYDGDASAGPEIEISDDLPAYDDWDEAALRAQAEAETDRVTEELQPGKAEEGAAANAGEDARATAGETPALPGEGETPSGPAGETPALHPEVTLKIRRRKFQTRFRTGEIHVTRRLFRTGDSEYLLNGKLCRLRDIQDIFMGTGLGPESYAIIEQGRIGQILSTKPTERRAIIEEAAGITKFKVRKRLAEARLEDARQNLARVNDIFEEVTRQMNSLKRQASKAERYSRLREEMRSKLRLVLASRFAQLQRESAELKAELERLSQEMARQGEAVRVLEAEHGERTQRGYAIESESRQTRQRLAEIALEVDRATAKQRHNEERCAELAARALTADTDLAQAAEKLATLEAERDANRQVLDSAAADVAAAQQEAVARQQDADAAAAALAEVEQQQETRRVAAMEAAAAASAVRNQITQAEERVAGLEREARRLESEIATARAQVDTFGGQRGQIAFEFETASQRVGALAAQIADNRQRLEDKRQAETESKRRLDSLRAEYAGALGKKASLEAMIAEHGYSTDSVRRLFQSGAFQGGHAPEGVLADFLEVEDRYEHVVEDFLRDELNYIVVKSWDAADEGMRLLQTNVDGRATFMVHPSDSQAKFSFILDEAAHPAPRPRDQITPLKSTIRVLNGFGKSLEVILPKLRDGYIVPDPKIARELALENPDAFFLSAGGECFHNVTVTGGKQRTEGPLSMKRELRDILRQLSDLENTLRAEQNRAGTLTREITELTSLLERLEEEKREGEKVALTTGHNLQQLETEVARLGERLAVHERELRQISGERQEQQRLIESRRGEHAAAEERRAAVEREIASAQESLPALRQAREAAAHTAAEMLARVAALEERRHGAAAALQRIESLAAEVAGRVEALRVQMATSATERLQREAENVELAAQVVALGEERQTAEAREQELAAESTQVRARLARIEEELHTVRAALDAARDRRGEEAAQAARVESDHQHMAETAMNELGASLEELAADPALVAVEAEQLALEETAYREMRAKLEAMGPVNMMALEEYNETRRRHEFLDTQRKDLLESIANTVNTIREIETVSRQKFQEAFARINENFQAAFRKLFGGGNAFMRLTDEENSAESGIDIVASPPGKKLQNVLLLSGGEKALTALSLLVGIFQYQPSPFCILDEVDAPLDEANIGRFTELVREMSAQTQFVLITHSKKTMSIAPVLYGVTMQEPGVSKLVSVRFHEEARASA
jgi:chromosome segregation protein